MSLLPSHRRVKAGRQAARINRESGASDSIEHARTRHLELKDNPEWQISEKGCRKALPRSGLRRIE
jgi:hypothetical protein